MTVPMSTTATTMQRRAKAITMLERRMEAPAIEAADQMQTSPTRKIVMNILMTGLILPGLWAVERTERPSSTATTPKPMVAKAAMNCAE